VLGLVRRKAEEDLGGGVVDQRAWRRHGGALVVWVGIGEEAFRFDQNRSISRNVNGAWPNLLCLYLLRVKMWPSPLYQMDYNSSG
jgi:hypothetical protein